MKKITIIGILLFIIYPNIFADENPDEISNYYKRKIDENSINPLSMLKTVNEEKYNIIINFISDNETIENYFYEIGMIINENEYKQITIDEDGIFHLPENSTIYIEYIIYYYEIFLNKYNNWIGDPTGKCFSVLFYDNNDFIKKNWKEEQW
jgi:hypothetical protein